MLDELRIDQLLDSGKIESRYELVLACAKRARQINEYTATLGLNDSLGIPGPQVHARSQHPLSIAIEELREDKLKVGYRESGEERVDVPISTETMGEDAADAADSADAADDDEAGAVAVESAGEEATAESAAGEAAEGEIGGGTGGGSERENEGAA